MDDKKLVFETSQGVEPILSFDRMGIKDDLLRGIYSYGFEKPSAIQQRAVVPIISGRDVIAQAQSGTGKTSMIALTVCHLPILVPLTVSILETRVEYFRGKDFASFLRNHSELKGILETDENLEVEDIANVLLQKNLLIRCDRVVKTVRPGKKKLSTWPAHLEIFPEQVFSENDAFFAWAFVKRNPLWQTLLSLFWPVLTLAICLFPVYPHCCKLLIILYSCAGVLLLILCLLVGYC